MNDASDIPQFGTAMPGLVYGERPSAYGVAVNAAGRVLVCRRSRGRILLPGGGLHAGESPRSTATGSTAPSSRAWRANSPARAWRRPVSRWR